VQDRQLTARGVFRERTMRHFYKHASRGFIESGAANCLVRASTKRALVLSSRERGEARLQKY
jgi:hypothetical protein